MIVGCRIIDSPRERLLAILTNNFVPCNGRFPTLDHPADHVLCGHGGWRLCASLLSALLLTAADRCWGGGDASPSPSCCPRPLLKGVPSSFALELPPYRKPQVGKVIVAVHLGPHPLCAGPGGGSGGAGGDADLGAGQCVGGRGEPAEPLCRAFWIPFARLMGLDGVILMAFILGFPANEIVLPIVIMAYLATGQHLESMDNLLELKALLLEPRLDLDHRRLHHAVFPYATGPAPPPC